MDRLDHLDDGMSPVDIYPTATDDTALLVDEDDGAMASLWEVWKTPLHESCGWTSANQWAASDRVAKDPPQMRPDTPISPPTFPPPPQPPFKCPPSEPRICRDFVAHADYFGLSDILLLAFCTAKLKGRES
jgi:hypothetical protein